MHVNKFKWQPFQAQADKIETSLLDQESDQETKHEDFENIFIVRLALQERRP